MKAERQKPYVVLTADNLQVKCNTQSGGAPLDWLYRSIPLVSNFPGSGAQVTYEFGQDPTQSTANGFEPNPIATLNGGNSAYNYYNREEELNPAGHYTVSGFYPCFWLSYEAADDSIPPHALGGHGWKTLYTDPLNPGIYTNPDLPIYFQAKGNVQSGIFLPGNELSPVGLPWQNRIAKFHEGRVAIRSTITFKEATSAFAGFVLRKDFNPTKPNPTQDDLYMSDGYLVLVNKDGYVSIHRRKAGNEIVVFQKRLSLCARLNLNKSVGLNFEVRTHNILTGLIEVYYNGTLLGRYTDADPILGEVNGIIASCTSGRIKFWHRQIFNLNYTSQVSYTALAGSRMRIEHNLKLAPGVVNPSKLYRVNWVFFLNQQTFPADKRQAFIENLQGVRTPFEGVFLLSDVRAAYAGDGNIGIYAQVINPYLNGAPSPEAHGLIQKVVVNNEFVLHFNWLSRAADAVPVEVVNAGATLEISVQL